MVEKMRSPKNLRWITVSSWSLIALAYLVFFLVDLRLDFAQLQTPCTGLDCNYLAISQAEIEVLESWGLSLRTYSLILNGATVLAVAVSCILGGLIQWRHGISSLGWAVSLALIIIPITMISDANNLAAKYPGLFILSVILSQVGSFILLLFIYIFPNGRFYPRRSSILFVITFLFLAVLFLELAGLIRPPAWVSQTGGLALIALFFLAGGFQILRYRRISTSLERQQTKWVLLGIFGLILCLPVWFLFFGGGLDIPPGQPRLLASLGAWLTLMFMIISLPVAMAIAIQRYRLWDIDLIIRRTLVYTSLTAALALVYFGLVITLEGALRPLVGEGGQVATVISTLTIAALFTPLRRQVQEVIDRRFYRQKYNAEQALAEFAATARAGTDLEALTAQVVDIVEKTVQPEQVLLWLKPLK